MNETSWSDAAFKERIEKRAEELGTTVREIMREAGLAEDTLNHEAVKGRRIDVIFKIAAAARMTPEEALGLPSSPSLATRRRLERLALVADIAAHLYVALSSRAARGEPEDLSLVETLLRVVTEDK